jgi:hypothetical protein
VNLGKPLKLTEHRQSQRGEGDPAARLKMPA